MPFEIMALRSAAHLLLDIPLVGILVRLYALDAFTLLLDFLDVGLLFFGQSGRRTSSGVRDASV